MKILVVIASHGTKNDAYLDRVVTEYQAFPWQVEIVVLSNVSKPVRHPATLRVGTPVRNPWSLPFGHRALFAEKRDQYDLFIYSEDDTLVRRHNVEAFLELSSLLGPKAIVGFLRTEMGPTGSVYVSSVHGPYRWDLQNIVHAGGLVFAPFTNEHSACYMATRTQLAQAISSGGFTVPPHEGRYDMLCTAATDIYTNCGLTRYLCLSRLDDLLLPHLPNKYIGTMGIPLTELIRQVDTVVRVGASTGWRGPLFDVDSGLPKREWSKDLYDTADPQLLKMVPRQATRLLSVGCGWGATEEAIARTGVEVVGVPIDPVFADALRRRRLCAIEGPLPDAIQREGLGAFDCVLLQDALHLLPEPVQWLRALKRLINDRNGCGCLVASVPNTGDMVERLRSRLATQPVSRPSRISRMGSRQIRKLLGAGGFTVRHLHSHLTERRARADALSMGALRTSLATRFYLEARPTSIEKQ